MRGEGKTSKARKTESTYGESEDLSERHFDEGFLATIDCCGLGKEVGWMLGEEKKGGGRGRKRKKKKECWVGYRKISGKSGQSGPPTPRSLRKPENLESTPEGFGGVSWATAAGDGFGLVPLVASPSGLAGPATQGRKACCGLSACQATPCTVHQPCKWQSLKRKKLFSSSILSHPRVSSIHYATALDLDGRPSRQ